MTGISLRILSGITSTQFRFLYKALGGLIFSHFTNILQLSRTLKLSRTSHSPNFQEVPIVLLVLFPVSFYFF